jgi:hypothetical protein
MNLLPVQLLARLDWQNPQDVLKMETVTLNCVRAE